ncbi:hypothetical protein MSG28_006018 [Choristoneura fumiferana]|uniref:Uncharacterized protein n=1 Tax=Choristoneura fumiferana TaxID=7141 RepID=A0ACC0L230_CHOFU|nr:hypothetical protein MSG28_006018 [Choristoneura fumiferana]
MDHTVLAVLGILMVLCLILFIGIYICKWIYEFYYWIKEKIWPSRETNEVPSGNIQSMTPIELRLPSYEEAISQLSDLTTRRRRRRRRNHSHNDVASDNVNNIERGVINTQLDGESTGDSNNGESSNENGNSNTRESENDRFNVTLSFGENNVVRFSSNNENGNESNAADDSGVKSGSGDDTTDKLDNMSISSIYETASGSSAGGGDSRAPSPWINF